MQYLKQNYGFTLLEVVLLVVVTALIVGAGVYAYDQHTKQSQPTSQYTTKAKSTTAKPASINDTDAANFVKQFYVDYAGLLDASNADAPPDSSKVTALIAKDGTQSFVTAFGTPRSYDPVVCGQNGITVNDVTIINHSAASATTALVTVGENAAGTGESATPKVSVVASGSSFKIDSITCPGLQ